MFYTAFHRSGWVTGPDRASGVWDLVKAVTAPPASFQLNQLTARGVGPELTYGAVLGVRFCR
jgi:hypothetical protein